MNRETARAIHTSTYSRVDVIPECTHPPDTASCVSDESTVHRMGPRCVINHGTRLCHPPVNDQFTRNNEVSVDTNKGIKKMGPISS
jgi:hypothetical protein